MTQAKFKLKCLVCGYKETRLAEHCKGEDGPACSKCYGPMILEQVTVKK